MNDMVSDPGRQAGFSLLELVVATLLSMILTAGVVSVYIASKNDYTRNNVLEAVQRSARSSLNLLNTKIRMAGYIGCSNGVHPESILKTDLASYSATMPVQGYEYAGTGMGATYRIKSAIPGSTVAADPTDWSPSLPADIGRGSGIDSTGAGSVIPGSDMLLIHEAIPDDIRLVEPYTDGAGGLLVAPGQGIRLAVGELAIISDCTHADLFQISNITENDRNGNDDRIEHASNSMLNPGNDPRGQFTDNNYGADSQILRYQTYLFYIGQGPDGTPSLYEVSIGTGSALGQPAQVVSGVENMQLLYGVDTDGDDIPNQYVSADQVTDWDHVLSIRVALLIRGGGNDLDAGKESLFNILDPSNGLTLKAPGDGRVRRSFEETISIRNRLP